MKVSFATGLLLAVTSARYLDGHYAYTHHDVPHEYAHVERHVTDYDHRRHDYEELPHEIYKVDFDHEVTPEEYHHDSHPHHYDERSEWSNEYTVPYKFGEWGEKNPDPDFYKNHSPEYYYSPDMFHHEDEFDWFEHPHPEVPMHHWTDAHHRN